MVNGVVVEEVNTEAGGGGTFEDGFGADPLLSGCVVLLIMVSTVVTRTEDRGPAGRMDVGTKVVTVVVTWRFLAAISLSGRLDH